MNAPSRPELGAFTETRQQQQAELHKAIAKESFNKGLRAGQFAAQKQLDRARHEIHQLKITIAALQAERDNALGAARG